jgi:hypothetical protein
MTPSRRRLDTATWALVLTVFVQFGTIIWFASATNAAVLGLRQATDGLATTTAQLRDALTSLDKRVVRLETLSEKASVP